MVEIEKKNKDRKRPGQDDTFNTQTQTATDGIAKNATASTESKQSVKVDLASPKRGRNALLFGGISFAVMAVVAFVGFGVYAYSYTNSNIVDKEEQQGIIGSIRRIIDDDVQPLRGEENDRINVLLLGQGGLDHPGGTLTDTIIVASVKPSTNEVALISLPRDMVISYYPDPSSSYYEFRKINYVMELGGIDFAKEKISEVTGLNVDYYVLIDFAGFRKVIDTLGGLDVYVENGFTDYRYPDYNFGYQTITFEEGWQHLDGEQALQYARSRHGNNGEGSDFARARRQQIILEAVRDELLSASTLLNPGKLTGLLNDLGEHVSTDIELWEMMSFAQMAEQVNQEAIANRVVDNSEGGFLHSEISSETGAYILIPNAGLGDYSEIHDLALGIFGDGYHSHTIPTDAEQSVVAVQNGTTIAGYAASTASTLESSGLDVVSIDNALAKNVPATVIYDLTGGAKPETAALLEQQLNTAVVLATVPQQYESRIRLSTDLNPTLIDISKIDDSVEFLVLLGSATAPLNEYPEDSSAGAPNSDV